MRNRRICGERKTETAGVWRADRAGQRLISGYLLFMVFFSACDFEAAVDLLEEYGAHHLVRECHVRKRKLHVRALADCFA